MSSIEDRRQTDRIYHADTRWTSLLLASTPDASPRSLAADDVTMETTTTVINYAHMDRRRSATNAFDLDVSPCLLIPARCGQDSYTRKNKGQRSVDAKGRVETNAWTDTTDRITFPAYAISEHILGVDESLFCTA